QIKNVPDFYPAYLAIGYTYLAEENADSAETWIKKSLEIAPNYAQAHYALYSVYEMRQQYDDALAELDQTAAFKPDYPGLAQTRNILRLKNTEMHLTEGRKLVAQNPEEALRHFKMVEKLAPEMEDVKVEIAQIYLQQNNCAEAIPYLDSAQDQVSNPR